MGYYLPSRNDSVNLGLPLDGLTGQLLAKASDTDFDLLWVDPPAGTGGGGNGTVTSVSLAAPAGFSVAGSPVNSSGTLTLTFAAGYSLPTTASQGNWDTAFAERRYWDGGATGLTAATGRASLELGGAATLSVGTTTGTVAAGDDSRITGALAAATAATTYQPLDSDLTAIAALSTTAFGRSLLISADAAAARTTIGIAAADAAPQPLGATAAIGSSTDYAREDHVHARSTYAELGPVADGIIFTISNRGETATPSTNYDESLPLSFAVTITKVTFITHIDNTGSSTTTLSAYKRTAAGTKTSLLSANATLVSGASVAVASLSATAGVLSLVAGDRLGVDLVGLGTGASGIKCIIEYTRSAI